jgi:hypothetical protein
MKILRLVLVVSCAVVLVGGTYVLKKTTLRYSLAKSESTYRYFQNIPERSIEKFHIKGGGGATPEDAVKGMMDAAIAKNWEKTVSYIDVEGMVELMKKQIAGMSEEVRKEMEKTMGDMLDVKKAKAKMIEQMKQDDKAVTSYKIIEVKDKTDKSATVVVETVEGKETKKNNIPVVKVGNVWKMGMAEMPAIEQ